MVQDLSNRFPQHKYYKVYPDALSLFLVALLTQIMPCQNEAVQHLQFPFSIQLDGGNGLLRHWLNSSVFTNVASMYVCATYCRQVSWVFVKVNDPFGCGAGFGRWETLE